MNVLLLNTVENIVAKEEIAHNELFLLMSKGFLKLSASNTSKCIYIYRKGLIYCHSVLDFEVKVSLIIISEKHPNKKGALE